MKIILSSMLALAIAGSPVATQEPDEKEKPKQQEPKKQPEPKAKPAQEPDDKPKPKPKPQQEPAPPPKQQKPDEKQQQKDEKERQKQQKEQAKKEKNRPAQDQTAPQNNRKQQASGKGQRIPPEKFRSSFGREHHFRVTRSGGDNRRFQYSGYWFEVVEVWPAGWSFDDDCYIEENGDDYYLVDVVHPEIRILVIVVSA
jgi:outer membrane biosynthesis protein TonB